MSHIMGGSWVKPMISHPVQICDVHVCRYQNAANFDLLSLPTCHSRSEVARTSKAMGVRCASQGNEHAAAGRAGQWPGDARRARAAGAR